MPDVRLSNSVAISFGTGVPVKALQAVLATAPEHAAVSVDHYPGDQRDPASTTITLTWSPIEIPSPKNGYQIAWETMRAKLEKYVDEERRATDTRALLRSMVDIENDYVLGTM